MSPGLSALRRQLTQRGAQAPSHVLGTISALRELEAVCDAVIAGRGAPYPQNRQSLIADSQAALDELGPNVKIHLKSILRDCRRQIGDMATALDSVAATRSTRLTVCSMLQRVNSADAVAAAWRDVVATFFDPKAEPHNCELRVLQLVELAENRGVDYDAWAARAERIIGDEARMLSHLGETVAMESPSVRDLAGVDEQRRIDLCEETLDDLPERSGVAVWLALSEAPLLHHTIPVGPVTLFAASGWPDRLQPAAGSDNAADSAPPMPELHEQDFVGAVTEALGDRTSREGFTLARVWFAESTAAFARAQARTVVRGLIDLAETDTSWRLLDGEMTWTSETWSGTGYGDPLENAAARRRKPPRLDKTQAELQRFDGSFIERWLAGDRDAQREADDALWLATTKQTLSYEQRIISAVRAIEHALAHVQVGARGTWVDSAIRYLRAILVYHKLINDLQDATFCALSAVERAPERPAGLLERLNRMVNPSADESYTWPALAADLAEVLPQVEQIVLLGSMEHRIVRSTKELLRSPERALEWLLGVESWFGSMVNRVARQRNALVHGTGATPKLLQNVDDFAILLATYAAHNPLRVPEDGRDRMSAFELDRTLLLELKERLAAGTALHEALAMQ